MKKIKSIFVWLFLIFSFSVLFVDAMDPAVVVADWPKTPNIPQPKVESKNTQWLAPKKDSGWDNQDKSNENSQETKGCDWIKLNTDFPIIWNCIHIKKTDWKTDVTQAFPTMIGALTKIIVSIILVVCFIMIIVAWIMRASSWDKAPTKAKWLIMKVAITILLLWFSWVILKLINPNFFS